MRGSAAGSGSFLGKIGKMASNPSNDMCASCFTTTKYVCISCDMAICNKCSCFESDEEKPNWVAGRSVGYCDPCDRERKAHKVKVSNVSKEDDNEKTKKYRFVE